MADQNKRNLSNILYDWKWFIRFISLVHLFATVPLCHCASLIFATHKFFYSLSLGDDDESYVNYRLTEMSLVTLQIVYI